MDVELQLGNSCQGILEELRFNPCFSGCRITAKNKFAAIHVGKGCFNPCFSGCRITAHSRRLSHHSPGRVSILVLVDVELQQKKSAVTAMVITLVSILVLVDVELQHLFSTWEQAAKWRFNPCFSGCRITARIRDYRNLLQGAFQSLF